MTLIRYQGKIVGVLGATSYGLIDELENRPLDDIDRQRIDTVCEFALDVRRITGREPGGRDSNRRSA